MDEPAKCPNHLKVQTGPKDDTGQNDQSRLNVQTGPMDGTSQNVQTWPKCPNPSECPNN